MLGLPDNVLLGAGAAVALALILFGKELLAFAIGAIVGFLLVRLYDRETQLSYGG